MTRLLSFNRILYTTLKTRATLSTRSYYKPWKSPFYTQSGAVIKRLESTVATVDVTNHNAKGIEESGKKEPNKAKKDLTKVDVNKLQRQMLPAPEPPEDGMCCGSGCEYCVWDIYDQEMEQYLSQARYIREVLVAQSKPVPSEYQESSLRKLVDPTVRAFVELEKKMQKEKNL